MQLKSLIRACVKNGITIDISNGNGRCTKGDRYVTFRENGQDSGEVTHLTLHMPDHRPEVDNFTNHYFTVMKHAINYLNGGK